MPVTEAMRLHAGRNLPLLAADLSVREAFLEAERFATGGRRVGALLMVDPRGRLAGLFTDGDLRRALIQHGSGAWDQPIARFMTRSPRALAATALVRDAVQMVREFRFDEIPVIDAEGKPVGMLDVLDLVALKVIEG